MPEQIFNMDEGSILLKRMTEGTFIRKETKSMPGFKVCVEYTVTLGRLRNRLLTHFSELITVAKRRMTRHFRGEKLFDWAG